MKTICVTGSTSRAGKTTLAALILSRLHGWSACKVTTCMEVRGEPCPRGREAQCGVCGKLDTPFEIEEEHGAESQQGTDTGRLHAAGAGRVLWVRTRPAALAEAVQRALAMLDGSAGVLFEGNHVLEVMRPDVAVMVLSADGALKPSARQVRSRVDFYACAPDDAEAIRKVLAAVSP